MADPAVAPATSSPVLLRTGYLVLARAPRTARRRAGVEAAVDVLRCHGPTELAWTRDLEEVGRRVEAVGNRRLVVVGGDGALHAAINLVDPQLLAGTTFALIPDGTGNDLARSVGLPLERDEAARLAATGEPRALDLLEVDGATQAHRWAHNALHSGIGVDAARLGTRWKRRLGAPAYALGAVLTGLRARARPVTVTIDGAVVHEGPALLVAALVGESVGGGFPLDPGGTPDERHLTVLVLADVRPLRRPTLAWALLRKDHRRHPDVVRRTGRQVEVVGHDEVDTDGEVVDVAHRWAATVRPAAWHLVVPGPLDPAQRS